MKALFWMATAAVLLSVAGPAWSLVSIDPQLAEDLRARGALQPLMRQLEDARDRGWFDLDNPVERTPGKMTTWNVLVILVDFDDVPLGANIKHKVLGKTWNWGKDSESLQYVKDAKGLRATLKEKKAKNIYRAKKKGNTKKEESKKEESKKDD